MTKRVYSEAHAAVRFFGESLDPLSVTEILRLPPDHTHRAGEPRLTRAKSGRVQERAPYREGMWSMSSEGQVDSPRLSVHVEWLLNELEQRIAAVRSLLRSGIEADIFCYSFGSTSTPPSLPRVLRDRATALGVEIVIDHYGVGSADEASAQQADAADGLRSPLTG